MASPTRAEAIATSDERSIDLLITDVIMPEMNGYELARRVTDRKPQTRVLFMSGYAAPMPDSEGVHQSLELLQKPFVGSALLQRVRKVLDKA